MSVMGGRGVTCWRRSSCGDAAMVGLEISGPFLNIFSNNGIVVKVGVE